MESSKQIIGIEQNNAEKIVETNENVDLEKVQMEEMVNYNFYLKF